MIVRIYPMSGNMIMVDTDGGAYHIWAVDGVLQIAAVGDLHRLLVGGFRAANTKQEECGEFRSIALRQEIKQREP